MTPHEFCSRWASRLDPAERDQFVLELAILLTMEQALERRRLFAGGGSYDPQLVAVVRDDEAKAALQSV